MRLGYCLAFLLLYATSAVAQDGTGLFGFLRLSGSNQSNWTPTTTLVPNLNADLCDSVNCSSFLTSETDPLSIYKDGSTALTVKIPFSFGLSTGEGSTKGIDIGSAGTIYDSTIPGDDRLYIQGATAHDIFIGAGSGRKVEFGSRAFFSDNVSSWGLSGTDGNIYWDDSTGPNPRFIIDTNDPVSADLLLDPQLDLLIDGDIIPFTDSAFTLGEDARRFSAGFLDALTVGTTSAILKRTSGLLGDASSSDLLTAIGTIDISSNTNLAVTAPIVLTGDTLSHATTAVTPGSYTAANITVDANGHITAAANGGTTYTGTNPIVVTGTVISFNDGHNFNWTGEHTFNTEVALVGPVSTDIIPIADNLRDLGEPATRWAEAYIKEGVFDGLNIGSLTGFLVASSGAVSAQTTIDISGNTNLAVDSGELTLTGDSLGLASTAVTPGSYTNTNLTVDAFGRITAASNGSGASYTFNSPLSESGGTVYFLYNTTNVWTGNNTFDSSISVTPTLDEYSNFGTPSSAIAVSDAVDRLVVSKIVTGSGTGSARGSVVVADYQYDASTINVTGAIQGLNAFAVTGSTTTSNFTTTGSQGGGLRAGRYSVNHTGTGLVAQASGISSGLNGDGPITDAFNYHAEMNLSASADIDRLGGLWIRTPTDSATIDSVYGVRINAFTGLTTTNLYPIAIDGTAKHIFFNAPTQFTESIGSETTDHLDYHADTHHDFNIGGAEELNIQANLLTFNNGSSDSSIGWGTNDRLDLTASNVLVSSAIEIDGAFNHDGSTFGALGATPVARPGSTNDIKDSLVSLGLITDGGATPLNLDTGALSAGNISSTALSAAQFIWYNAGVLASDGDASFDGINAVFSRLQGRIGYQIGGAAARVPLVLIRSNSSVGNSAGGAATNLWSETIAADTLEFDGDYITYQAAGTFAATANTKQITITLGSTTICDTGAMSITAAGDWVIHGGIFRTAANTQKNWCALTSSSLGTLTPPTDYSTSTEADTGSLTFALKGAGASASDIVFEVGAGTYNPQSS